MSVFQKENSLHGIRISDSRRQSMLHPLKDKCDAIRNLESPKTLRQTRAFCGMVNFLSSFLPNLQRLLIPIYDLQKKTKRFKWMDEAEKAFNEIKKLLVCPPILKAPTPDGLFRLKSDTLRRCGWYSTPKARRRIGSYWIPFKKSPKISKEFLASPS